MPCSPCAQIQPPFKVTWISYAQMKLTVMACRFWILGRGHTKKTGNRNATAISENCYQPELNTCYWMEQRKLRKLHWKVSNMCSTQADNNSQKLWLRCCCQFPWCALGLTVLWSHRSERCPISSPPPIITSLQQAYMSITQQIPHHTHLDPEDGSKTSVSTYKTTDSYNPEDNIYNHRRQNLKIF
jgi:hypothetical protein